MSPRRRGAGFCWRVETIQPAVLYFGGVFLPSMTWLPIVAADNELEAVAKAKEMWPKRTIVGAMLLHENKTGIHARDR